MKVEFVNLVENSKKFSDEFYKNGEKKSANPFYIGLGNPNAEVLIIGKEKGFDYEKNKTQAFFESINNPKEWHHYIKNEISYTEKKFDTNSGYYNNCFIPYLEGIKKSGHTWNKYKKLIQKIYPNDEFIDNFYLRNCFISEINHNPSERSKIRKFENPERINFLKQPFFKSFKTTILACGDYLDNNLIEEIFDVKFKEDLSKPRNKIVIFQNRSRVLINTRQLSFDVGNSYISTIGSYLLKS